MTYLWLIPGALAAWLLFNLSCMVSGTLFAPAATPEFDGFRIRIPPDVRAVLEDYQLEAVLQHEREHRRLMHPWKNLARACAFAPASPRTRLLQEFRADDAVENPWAMAEALRTLSDARLDMLRAARLSLLAAGARRSDEFWIRSLNDFRTARERRATLPAGCGIGEEGSSR